MKLKAPKLFQTLHQLPWLTGAIDALTWRRLYIRIFIATLLTMLVGGVFAIPGIVMGWNLITSIVMGAPGLVAAAILVWLFVQSIKMTVLRIRHLGIENNPAPFLVYFAAAIITMVAAGAQAYFLKHGSFSTAQIVGLGLLPMALLDGLLCFRETPFHAIKSQVLQPLGASMKGEKIAQFLLETYFWYSILRTPLDIFYPTL
jgi:hypothetical protein